MDYALGGWQLGGSFTAHTGFPLTIKTTDRSGTLARSARAQVIGTPNDSHIVGPGNHWLDGSAYAHRRRSPSATQVREWCAVLAR